MDEPTNDLDIETQELLEELLMEYTGTVVLVSHDRSFLNNVVTSTIVLEGNGEIYEYAGGYDDWLVQHKSKPAVAPPPKVKEEKPAPPVKEPEPKEAVRRKLSNKEQMELSRLPALIEKLEEEHAKLYESMADISFFQREPKEMAQMQARAEEVSEELLRAYDRWEYLDGSQE